jgi:hypothetical protein
MTISLSSRMSLHDTSRKSPQDTSMSIFCYKVRACLKSRDVTDCRRRRLEKCLVLPPPVTEQQSISWDHFKTY